MSNSSNNYQFPGVTIYPFRDTGVRHRNAITSADKLATPANVAATNVASTVGSLVFNTAYNVNVAGATKYGATLAATLQALTTTDDAVSTHVIRAAVTQLANAEYYDLFLSTDAHPKWVGRVTEAQRAAGCRILAVGVPSGDNASDIAGKIRTALAADSDVTALFNITGATTAIIATAKATMRPANDATLNIALADGTSIGVTAAPTSANTTAGVLSVLQVETATAVGTITGSGNLTATVTASGMSNSPKVVTFAVVNGDTAAQWATKARVALAADADVASFFTVSGATTAIILTSLLPAANDGTMNIALAATTATDASLPAATSANTTAGVAGVAQVETATAAGNITTSGNVSVTVTAAGMTNSPKTISVAVVATAGIAGSVDIGLVGTGVADNVNPFAVSNAYIPDTVAAVGYVNTSGKTKAYVHVKLTPTDLRSVPTLVITPFILSSYDSLWYQMTAQTLTLLTAVNASLMQTFTLTLDGAQGLVLLVDSLTGQGASVNIYVEPA